MAGRRSGGFIIRARREPLVYARGSVTSYARGSATSIRCRATTVSLLLTLSILSAQPPLKEFSHKKHLKLGNVAPVIAAAIDKGTYLGHGEKIRAYLNSSNACAACHRGMEDSDHVSRANMPQMADCLVCHNEIEPPYSCEFCHPKGAQLKPANHVGGFLDTHTNKNSGLDKQGCAVCHGRKFTCLGCHLK